MIAQDADEGAKSAQNLGNLLTSLTCLYLSRHSALRAALSWSLVDYHNMGQQVYPMLPICLVAW